MIQNAAAFLLLQAAVAQSAADLPVKMGFTLNPDTVVVGQPFNFLV